MTSPRRLPRRTFLAGAGAALVAACTRTRGRRQPVVDVDPSVVRAHADEAVRVSWSDPEGAEGFDLELNGTVVAEELEATSLRIGFGEGRIPFAEGTNTVRVRSRGPAGTWSQPASFEVRRTGTIRARQFDHEDDGEIELTVPSRGAAIAVGSAYAFGAGGKGARLRCTDASETRAYGNLVQLPVGECWVRLAVRPQQWGRAEARVHLARIRAHPDGPSERITWVTGREVRTTSVDPGVALPAGVWTQLQLGVTGDGTVELWIFDGRRERLVGRGRNPALAGGTFDAVSFGNDSPRSGTTFEVDLDEVAVGERRLPWARGDDDHRLRRPQPLDPDRLGRTFSFVFGSCHAASRVPYRRTALEAAARSDPDFVIHLGDFGYPDSSAYRQSAAGYRAIWSDLLYEERLAGLFRKPWLYLASDHDLGGNNVVASTLAPFALDAYLGWHDNDTAAEPDGRYGVVDLDPGRVSLVWVDTVTFRSPLDAPDGPEKTILGSRQRQWFLDLLGRSEADLIIVASQTTLAHEGVSGWARYPTERREVLGACEEARGLVRWVSGDHHTSRWARVGTLAEWGTAALAEVPQSCIPPLEDAEDSACLSFTVHDRRREVLAHLTDDEIDASTSFGRVVVDTRARTATFELRDRRGEVRVAPSGTPFRETVRYG